MYAAKAGSAPAVQALLAAPASRGPAGCAVCLERGSFLLLRKLSLDSAAGTTTLTVARGGSYTKINGTDSDKRPVSRPLQRRLPIMADGPMTGTLMVPPPPSRHMTRLNPCKCGRTLRTQSAPTFERRRQMGWEGRCAHTETEGGRRPGQFQAVWIWFNGSGCGRLGSCP